MRSGLFFLVCFGGMLAGWFAHEHCQQEREYHERVRAVSDRIRFVESEQVENRCRLNKLEERCPCDGKPCCPCKGKCCPKCDKGGK